MNGCTNAFAYPRYLRAIRAVHAPFELPVPRRRVLSGKVEVHHVADVEIRPGRVRGGRRDPGAPGAQLAQAGGRRPDARLPPAPPPPLAGPAPVPPANRGLPIWRP